MAAILLCVMCLCLFAGITHALTLSWARSGESIAQTVQVTDDDVSEENGDFSVPPDTANSQRNIEFAVADVLSLYIHSTQDVVLETNSSSAADDTINISANKPIIWYSGCGFDLADLFSADVTTVFFTTAEITDDATIKIRILLAGS